MKISTKGRYGLRALVDLAVHYNGDLIALKEIAERQNISENYLEQVFSTLRKYGLVTSRKGSQGGYGLSDNPSNTRVSRILTALEGDLDIVEQIDKFENTDCMDIYLQNNLWNKMNEAVEKVVNNMTLADLLEERNRLADQNVFMYYI